MSKNKLEEYKANPALFIKEILDDKPRWDKQTEIIESVRDNRNTYVKACHGVGKTFTAKDVALWFLYCFYPSTVLTTAPSWSQVEKLLWSEINHAHSDAKIQLGGYCKKTELFLDDNWFAIGVSPKIETEDDGKRLTGFHNDHLLVIFDEAPACNPKLWEIKETLMTSKNVRFLAIGNPVVGSGHFFDGFRDEKVNSISMSIFDSPNFKANNINTKDDLLDIIKKPVDEREVIFENHKYPFPFLTTPRWACERVMDWGIDSPITKSRVFAEFPDKTDDTIISLASIEACVDIDTQGVHRKVLGVDVARYGVDFTVFYGFENYRQTYYDRFNGQDLVKTANMIKHLILSEKYTMIVIDDTGMGGGVTDMLFDYIREKGFDGKVSIMPVNFANASTREEYDGIVTDMYYNAKELIEDKEISVFKNMNLFNELTNRKYKFTNKGKIKIESKDEYKKRTGLESPDNADAFVLALWGVRNIHGHSDIFVGDDRESFNSDF